MDCPQFRQHHLAYLDDTLPGDLLVSAERHVRECDACAAHDTMVRRAILLARNLPPIECSSDFQARLEARLREVDACGVDVPMDWAPSWRELAMQRLASRRGVAIAAGLLLMAAAGSTFRAPHDDEPVLLPPVLATRPESDAATVAAQEPRLERLTPSDLVGPASAGVPVWPAALLAGQVPAAYMGMGVTSSGVRAVNLTR